MSNPNALFLLADHIKLSLLERQRARTLNLDGDTQDGHISRFLDQFRDGLEALKNEQKRLEEAGEESKAANITDSLPSLEKQYDDLTAQFHGFSSPADASTLAHPNDPALAEDFAHATSMSSPDATQNEQGSRKKALRSVSGTSTPKTVRFSDNPAAADLEAQNPSAAGTAAAPSEGGASGNGNPLFPYRDDPDSSPGYTDRIAAGDMSNVQIHAYHQQILSDQDAQLDALGASISRQRELSMRIGDELDDQVLMLDEGERVVDRHQGRLDRARRQVARIAKGAGENKQMTAIVVLIVILVLLIIILK